MYCISLNLKSKMFMVSDTVSAEERFKKILLQTCVCFLERHQVFVYGRTATSKLLYLTSHCLLDITKVYR